MADITTLIEDMKAILDQDNDHECSEENLQWAAEAFKELLSSRFRKRTTGSVVRFSSLGKKDRQLWYEAHPPENIEKMPPQAMFKFLYGDVIELLLLFIAKESGHSVSHEQHTVEVDGVVGHTDAVIDGVPVDAKSASPYSYNKFGDGSFKFDDPFGYIKQLSGYAHALEDSGEVPDAKKGAYFLVANKVSGDFELAGIDEYDIEGNPPGPRIAELKKVVASETPPPRCYDPVPEGKSGNLKLDIGCSYCPFKDACWSDSNNGEGLKKFFYSRGPIWLTKVVKQPRVEEAV